MRSIKGYRRDSEVMYGGTLENSKRGRLESIFNESDAELQPATGTLTRSISQPDFMQELNNNSENVQQEPASIFVRPGIGSLAFRYIQNKYTFFSITLYSSFCLTGKV